ncbi:MAG: hypothetical protein QOJ92_1785 [Frankiales bacterium]|nr:hypothetical protein [Frankiales bacterium]
MRSRRFGSRRRVAMPVVLATVITMALVWLAVDGLFTTSRQLSDAQSIALGQTPAPMPATSVATAAPEIPLVAWRGPVEGLFVHPLVLEPQLAFTSDRLGQGFRDYFVTAREFRVMLEQLWRNGWTLVDAHRAALGQVRVPVGRRPLVLSEDDVNYYAYFAGRGLASRLVLDGQGEVKAEYDDGSGPRLTDQDVVPLVEAAVARHPELSADGAKGVIAVTGYEGLLGEHDLTDPATRAGVAAVARRLRETGWTFASHTFGHIDLSRASVRTATRDTSRWAALVGDLLGPVDTLIYPFGSRPTVAVRRLLRDAGFTIQLDIDIRAHRQRVDGVIVMSRRHIDGLAFANPRRLAQFLDVEQVRDPARPRG